MNPDKKINVQTRRTTQQKSTGRHAQALGVRVGYWPCLKSPFFQVVVGSYQFEIWYGLPSYKKIS